MFYCKFFIVLSLITIGSSLPSRRSSINKPQRCCGVKEFNSKITVSTGMALPSGQSYASYGYFNLSYNENRGLVGLKGLSIDMDNGKQTNLWIIKNVHDGQMYAIDLDTNQCSKGSNPVNPFNCIPKTATYIDSSMYGYQDKQIIGDTWMIQINGTTSYATVSRDDCVPLTLHHFLNEPRTVTTMTTTDYVAHVDDLSVFDIPPQCLTLA